jgi:prepilin-type N-terminal cleavage/methylation domain-containing protein
VHNIQHKEEVVKRKGFTLIELMVVIAIIIILAAIAIPNYLKMTERAKKSRIASDMATLATGLETFKTDWGAYPSNATDGTGEGVSVATGVVYSELAGTNASPATINLNTRTNSLGEVGGIEYLKAGTLTSIIDPFSTGAAPANGLVYYLVSANNNHWVLYAYSSGEAATGMYFFRTSNSSTVIEATKSAGTAMSDLGVLTK